MPRRELYISFIYCCHYNTKRSVSRLFAAYARHFDIAGKHTGRRNTD